MIEFPNYLVPVLDGFSETINPVVYRSDFESGPAKQRSFQCGLDIIRNMNFTVCGCDNMNNFRNWFINDICNGSLWFKFFDPCDETYKRARIPDSTYTASPDNNAFETWSISITIETRVYKNA